MYQSYPLRTVLCILLKYFPTQIHENSILYSRILVYFSHWDLNLPICSLFLYIVQGFPGGTVVKNLPANARDARVVSLIPESGRFSGGGHGNPLQYCWLENSMDRGVMGAYGVTKESRHDWAYTHTCTWYEVRNRLICIFFPYAYPIFSVSLVKTDPLCLCHKSDVLEHWSVSKLSILFHRLTCLYLQDYCFPLLLWCSNI